MLNSNFIKSHVYEMRRIKTATTTIEWKRRKKKIHWEFSFPHSVKLMIDSYGWYELLIMFDLECVYIINAVMITTIFFLLVRIRHVLFRWRRKNWTGRQKKINRNDSGNFYTSELPNIPMKFFLQKCLVINTIANELYNLFVSNCSKWQIENEREKEIKRKRSEDKKKTRTNESKE